MRSLSLDQIYLGFMLFFSIVLGIIALVKAPNDAHSIASHLATAGGVAAVVAAFFTVPIWIVLEVAG